MSVMRPFFLAVWFTAVTAPVALGQVYIGRDTPRRGSVEVTGGGAWSPGFDVQSVNAELTRSAQNDGFDLFSVSGDVSGFPGAYARLGLYLTNTISIEGGIRFAKPKLAYRLTGDAESAADETAVETLSHYVFDGSILFHFTNASFASGRGVPFVSAGGGYIRELHEGNELVETGNEFHATAGVKYWFGTGRRRLGLRAEAGFSSRQKGLDDDEARRTLPLVLGGISLLF
jgi:hypothetical protein